MSIEWQPTPDDERRKASRLTPEGWETVEMSELRKGDIFKITFDGEFYHPLTEDHDDQVVAVATADAIRMDPLGSTGQWYGYGVEIEIFDCLDQIKSSLS